MDDREMWAFTIGMLAAVFVGLPALGFLGYWAVALMKIGWEFAARL